MKRTGLLVLLFCSVVFCLGLAAAETPNYEPEREIRRYFPGDYVHILVSAPLDTAKITGVMPNGDTIELVHDRRAKVWSGLWQVPIGFKAGSYNAELQASDIEGNKYSGLTSPFIVGELTMITMIQKPVTPEAETSVRQQQRMSRETALLAAKAVTPIPHPQVPQPEAVSPIPPPQVPSEIVPSQVVPPQVVPPKVVKPRVIQPVIVPSPAKKKVALAPKKKKAPAARPKPAVNFVEAKEKSELNLTKAKIVTSARYYMERMDFNKVQGQLRTLVKIDPHNQAYKKMLQRVETVIKTEKEKNQ
jgi:hypothetical protein